MDYREALKKLDADCRKTKGEHHCGGKNCLECYIATAKDAVSTQIPAKPIIDRWEKYDKCPVCGDVVRSDGIRSYWCPGCGKRIDWKGVAE